MPAGRPRLPTELKKLKGTINTTVEKRYDHTDVALVDRTNELLVPQNEKPRAPKSLHTRDGRKFWGLIMDALTELQVLAKIDLSQVEQLCVTYERMKKAQKESDECDSEDEKYDLLLKRWMRLVDQFNRLSAMYYISPVVRSRLRLEELSALKTKQDIEKKDDAISLLIAGRKAND